MTDKLQKPIEPAANECCGGGSCCPCVWDAYNEQLRRWQTQQGIEPGPLNAPATTAIDRERFYR